MKNLKTFDAFLNETVIKIPVGEVRKDEVRINALSNKVYLVNFEKNTDKVEQKKFITHIKSEFGSTLTQITTHLGDLVLNFSTYVTNSMVQQFKDTLNDMFTARAENNMGDSKQEDPKEPEGLLDGK